jgi:hypothetical protein
MAAFAVFGVFNSPVPTFLAGAVWCLTELLGASDFCLTLRGQDWCHTQIGFAASQQSHSHDSTHPKHKTRRSIPRRARLRLSGRHVSHDDPRGADALACDGDRSPSRGHAPAEEAALRGQALDPVAADAPPSAEQGPKHARQTEPSSAAARPRLLCAGAAATRVRVNPARNAGTAHRWSRPGSRDATSPSPSAQRI